MKNTREKNNQEFFIYGPQCKKCKFLDIRGRGGGGGLGSGYDWAHLAQLSSDLNQSTCKIWKQSAKDILCYLENDEISADAA